MSGRVHRDENALEERATPSTSRLSVPGPGVSHSRQGLAPGGDLVHLQRAAGNRATAHLVAMIREGGEVGRSDHVHVAVAPEQCPRPGSPVVQRTRYEFDGTSWNVK